MPNVVLTKKVKPEGSSLPVIVCVESGPGIWMFTVRGYAWKYNERLQVPHFNLAMVNSDHPEYAMRFNRIEEAVTYAFGFGFGYHNGYAHGSEDVKGVEKMTEEQRNQLLNGTWKE